MNTQAAAPNGHQSPKGVQTRIAWCVAMVLAVLPSAFVMSPGQAAADDPPTVVSLTFDDASASQLTAAALMKDRGMAGTFYTNSGTVGKTGYVTRTQLDQLAADGHEIGGHTLNHANLPTLPPDEAKRQICLDRANLTAWGFNVRSFAYPFAENTATVSDLVRDCGYNSGRGVGGLRSRFGCNGCSYSESIPPVQQYGTRSHNMDGAWTLQDYKDAVTNAESSGGGWVQLTFHTFCGAQCGALAVNTEIFTQFLDWLGPRAASNNTVVKTVGDVIGGDTKPVVTVDPTPIQDESGLNNPSLESLATSTGLPTCWQVGSGGTNTSTIDTVTPGRTGQVAGRVTVSSFTDGDARLVTTRDLGTCAPSVTPGKTYVLRGWYTSTATTRFVVHRRDTAGTWSYWTTSNLAFSPSSTYNRAVWTTPAVPANTTAISFGLNLATTGTLTVDDFSLSATDSVPKTSATVAPTAPDGAAGWYRTRPVVTLTVDLGSAAATTEYSVDDGATWQPYTAPFDAPDGQKVSYRSKAGSLVEATRTLDLNVDTTPPVVAPSFNDTTRTLTVTATDTNGSGIALIERRAAGTTAWTPVTGPEVLGRDSAELEFRATDKAGNASAIETLTVPAAPDDKSKPTVTLSLGSSLTYGKANTATVTVTVPAGRPTPTGTVTIMDGTTAIGSMQLTGGKAAISLSSTLEAGTRTITASYGGDAATSPGVSTVKTVTVKKATPEVTFSLSTSRPRVNSTSVQVTVNLRIAGSSVRPSGIVYIRLNGTTIQSMTISSSDMGTRSVTLPPFTKRGIFRMDVMYGGSSNVNPGTSSGKTIYVI